MVRTGCGLEPEHGRWAFRASAFPGSPQSGPPGPAMLTKGKAPGPSVLPNLGGRGPFGQLCPGVTSRTAVEWL